MDDELRELLTAWLGGDVDEARLAPLLARLRSDAALRAAFVAEIHLLGKLKAVQTTEPRWLRLEDALGWQAAEPREADFEDRVLARLQPLPPPRRRRRFWLLGAVAAAALVGIVLTHWLPEAPPVPPSLERGDGVAALVKVEGNPNLSISPNTVLERGPLRFEAGRATLAFVGGVMLVVEGPADLDLISSQKIACRHGKLRASVPPGAEGFTIATPGAAIVDLGTELAVNVGNDGKSDLIVFEGRAEVSLLDGDGDTVSSRVLDRDRAVSIEPRQGRIDDIIAEPGLFASGPDVKAPPLELDPDYGSAVRKANPWGYWRFQSLTDGLVANEIAGRPPLRASGPVRLGGEPDENHSAEFLPRNAGQQLLLDGTWTPPAAGHAVELWCLSEAISPMAVASLIAVNDDDQAVERHLLLLQLTGRPQQTLHQPGALRFLHRDPPGISGGVNLFCRHLFTPYRWHHLVVQRRDAGLEMYFDGTLARRMDHRDSGLSYPCRLLLGRLKERPLPPPNTNQVRPFAGRIDEVAVYDHPLTVAQIALHFQLGNTEHSEP